MDEPLKGPFKKGDPRINRKGRPKTFDAIRALAQNIAHDRSGVIDKNGNELTVIEAILRKWATSKDPRLQIAFVEYAYGKPPVRSEITGENGGGLKIVVEYANDKAGTE